MWLVMLNMSHLNLQKNAWQPWPFAQVAGAVIFSVDSNGMILKIELTMVDLFFWCVANTYELVTYHEVPSNKNQTWNIDYL
jgi:hypothetical protein